jgi:hypothetical protein
VRASKNNKTKMSRQTVLRAIETALDLGGCVRTLDDTDQSSVDQGSRCIEIVRGSAFLVAGSRSIDAQTAGTR